MCVNIDRFYFEILVLFFFGYIYWIVVVFFLGCVIFLLLGVIVFFFWCLKWRKRKNSFKLIVSIVFYDVYIKFILNFEEKNKNSCVLKKN